MVAQEKTPLTIRDQKKRDAWERKVKVAYAHVQSQKNMHRIYQNDVNNTVKRYEEWLKRNNFEPLIDLNQYK
jgi:hypothetical protein